MKMMHLAFKKVKSNRGAPGYDKISIRMFERNLEQNLCALHKRLTSGGKYFSKPVRRKFIDKGNGKKRPLGIPAVRDRVAQEVARILLEPIFEPLFHDCSFGFRPKRKAHQAIERILDFHKRGYKHVVDADIKGFFDNIEHELIIDLVAQYVADGSFLLIIRRFLKAPIVENGRAQPNKIGTPQGGVISPLLANIVLNQLDQRIARASLDIKFVRYADDFVVLAKLPQVAQQALTMIKKVIEEELSLQLAPEKSGITEFRKGFDFLGFHINSYGVTIRKKSVEKFKDNLRSKTKRSHGFNHQTIRAVNRVISGFKQYFDTPFSTIKAQATSLDEWIRRRLRCMKFKRFSRKDNFRFSNASFNKLGLIALTGHT